MGRGPCRFTLKQKLSIVEEAYSIPGNVQPTAKKYRVCAANIRRWRKLPRHGIKPNDRAHHTNPRFQMPQVYDHLLGFFHTQREKGVSVTLGTLLREALRKFPNIGVKPTDLHQRIYRWLKQARISHRRVTHEAQNLRWDQEVIEQWTWKVNETILRNKYDPNAIINMDETNFDFDDAR
jgi:hypothetical protein